MNNNEINLHMTAEVWNAILERGMSDEEKEE